MRPQYVALSRSARCVICDATILFSMPSTYALRCAGSRQKERRKERLRVRESAESTMHDAALER